MLHDLDSTIEALFKYDRPDLFEESNNPQQVAISFVRPDEDFLTQSGVMLPAIDLFLYDVREHAEIRRNEVLIERQNGTATKKYAPLRVDCSYLVTAWSKDNSMLDEHRLLGEVMTILMRYREIPCEVMQGGFKESEPQLRALGLRESHLNSLGEFWQAIGGKAKTALHYRLTMTVDLFDTVEAPIVKERKFKMDQKNPLALNQT